MAISRAQLLKELLPGLNALFGMEYARYGEEHKAPFTRVVIRPLVSSKLISIERVRPKSFRS